MLEINKYLSNYWSKYPQEQLCDPSYLDIKRFIENGGKYFLKDNIFIVYKINEASADILHYWCDMKDMSKNIIKNTLINHKKFIKSLNVPAYSKSVKDLFKRKYLVEFNEIKKSWRWL